MKGAFFCKAKHPADRRGVLSELIRRSERSSGVMCALR